MSELLKWLFTRNQGPPITRRQALKDMGLCIAEFGSVGLTACATLNGHDSLPQTDMDRLFVAQLASLLEYSNGISMEDYARVLHRKTYIDSGGKWGTSMTVGQYRNAGGDIHSVTTDQNGQEVPTKQWVLDFSFPKPPIVDRSQKTIVDIAHTNGFAVVHGTLATTGLFTAGIAKDTTPLFASEFFAGSKTRTNLIFLNYLPHEVQLKDDKYGVTRTPPGVNAATAINFDKDTTFVFLNMNLMLGYAQIYGIPMDRVIIQALANEKANFLAHQIQGRNAPTPSEAPSLFAGLLAMKDRQFSDFFLGPASANFAILAANEAIRLKR